MDSPREPYAWLEARPVRNASDMALGCVLLVAAATAFVGLSRLSFDTSLDHVGDRFFPTIVAALLGVVGAALLTRGAFGRTPPYGRWRLWQILVLAALTAGHRARLARQRRLARHVRAGAVGTREHPSSFCLGGRSMRQACFSCWQLRSRSRVCRN